MDSASLGKSVPNIAFMEVVSLFTGYFLEVTHLVPLGCSFIMVCWC